MAAFSMDAMNMSAVDRCLDAACASLGFDLGEVWSFCGEVQRGKALEPVCLRAYARPATIETYGSRVKLGLDHESVSQRHSLSPILVKQARQNEAPLWFTSSHPDTPMHEDLPLNTAVAIPLSLDATHKDMVAVFFSMDDVQRQETALALLTALSRAACTACMRSFPAFDSDAAHQQPPLARLEDFTEPNLDMRWDSLQDAEFLVNGSRCTIYTAFYKNLPVAVKLVRKDIPDKKTVYGELNMETDILMRLHHPNIVKLIGAGTQPERFMVIERLDGGTLAQRCGSALNIRDRRRRFRTKTPFTYLELVTCARQLAHALRYMHTEAVPGCMVIHRDLKPDNIAFDGMGNLKILDMGLAKVVPLADGDPTAVYKMTGETGSLRYMAPEVALRKPYNGKADVYGFGMILWEMAAMRKPFEGIGRELFFELVVNGTSKPPVDRNWPPEFGALLHKCWEKDPAKRPDFDLIINDLQAMIDDAKAQALAHEQDSNTLAFGQRGHHHNPLLGWLRRRQGSSSGQSGTPRSGHSGPDSNPSSGAPSPTAAAAARKRGGDARGF
ncbi:Serine/threonine-protein kinase CTR1 [Tribonema minus]|uniref:Serine/threonine-protein kinase CTR1 n=1 Tax=Tribonema minus TaxID=303371 RepID=A0A836C8Q0_9STRA|nr:Serine/threonine-protein kinase CTR1 [Tribonema minus]